MPDHSPAAAEAAVGFARWLRDTHGPALGRRTAERHAAFFLPYLRPGMTLLDVGCGPGSITVGLARAVAPGRAVGLDINPETLATAGEHAAGLGVANLSFERGDATDLPFEDGSFDAVFIHATLQHLEAPLEAVREARRVLRPGGVIGVADADHGGSIIAPDPGGLLARANEVVARVRGAFSGGNPYMGRDLPALLAEAGFAGCVASATATWEGSASAAGATGEWQAAYLSAEPFIAFAGALEIAQREELLALADAWRAWAHHPGAFWARFWCEAFGRVP
jgi:SAM-dependent methyltransferase